MQALQLPSKNLKKSCKYVADFCLTTYSLSIGTSTMAAMRPAEAMSRSVWTKIDFRQTLCRRQFCYRPHACNAGLCYSPICNTSFTSLDRSFKWRILPHDHQYSTQGHI